MPDWHINVRTTHGGAGCGSPYHSLSVKDFMVNRLLAVGLIAVWLVPISALFQLPKERATLFAEATGMLLTHTEQSAKEVAQLLNADVAKEMLRDREVATAFAADPQLLEGSLWQRWAIELAAVAAGLSGVWALWYRPRYWRLLTLLGVSAFAAVVGLHVAAKLVWMAAGSWEVTLKVLNLYWRQPSTTVTHLFGPFLLVICVGYVVFSRGDLSEAAA